MSTIPTNYDAALDWCVDHVPIWLANPAEIGLVTEDVTALQGMANQVNQLLMARNQARAAAIGATGAFNEAAKEMRDFASLQVAKVRTFAKGSDTPAVVYEDAQIPAPAKRSPRPAPGTPAPFAIALEQSGTLVVSFKCENPPRVGALTYRVERSLGAQQPFTFLVNAKSRRFEDATVPNGSGDVTYRVTAQSSTKDGAPGYFTVRFGAQNGAEIIRQGAAEGQQGAAKGKAR